MSETLKVGEQFMAVPHTAATDRLPLKSLVIAMALRPGLWHELKTFTTETMAWDRAVRLRRYSDEIEPMVQGRTLYARIPVETP